MLRSRRNSFCSFCRLYFITSILTFFISLATQSHEALSTPYIGFDTTGFRKRVLQGFQRTRNKPKLLANPTWTPRNLPFRAPYYDFPIQVIKQVGYLGSR